jgi:CRP-like cAMP-binding protein
LKSYLQSFRLFTDSEIEQIAQLAIRTVLKKGDFFIQEGNICSKVAFVESGILRHYTVSDEGNDSTYCFAFPNSLLTAYSSFVTNQPSVENIQAITDVEILTIPKTALENALAGSKNWLIFGKLMAEQEFIKLESRVFSLLKEKAKQRYLNLFSQNPNYIQQIPLHYLASYLGITQRHLSRLRRELIS